MLRAVALCALSVLCVGFTSATNYWWHFRLKDCPNEDVGHVDSNDPTVLEAACLKMAGCVAFNTDGYLKNSECTPQTMSGSTCDLYFLETSPQPSPTPTPSPTPAVWPQPKMSTNGSTVVFLDSSSFQFMPSPSFSDLTAAIGRYTDIIFSHPKSSRTQTAGKVMLPSLTISVVNDTAPLQLGVDESYTLTIPDDGTGAKLSAETYYGALRGLETFSQLIMYDHASKLYRMPNAPWSVNDAPRFPHRGMLLDSARHFEPVPVIKRVIDALSFAKMNTLHWHIVDLQSFPTESPSNPKLWDGSYSDLERYTIEDVMDVVEYARQRGIRTMLEFDTPGHAAAWCTGYPNICPSTDCNMPLDPSTNDTFNLIQGLFKDYTGPNFPESFLHLGGDEVNTKCWESTPHVASWMASKGFNTSDAYRYFVQRVQSIAITLGHTPVNWEEVWNLAGTDLDKRVVIHVWLNKQTLADVVAAGYRGILSNNALWYLDHLGVSWEQFYTNEPLDGITDPAQQKLVLGGSLEMWGETVDPSDIFATIFPRLLAGSERLWSPRDVNSTAAALPRLHWARCMMMRRGYGAAPVNNAEARTSPSGPGPCLSQ